MRALLLFALVAVVTALVAPAAAFAQNIGVIDRENAINSTKEGRRLIAKLTKQFEKDEAELRAEMQELASERDKIDQVPAEREKRQKAYEAHLIAHEAKDERYRRRWQNERDAQTVTLIKKMELVIARVAQRHGLTIVVDSTAVRYVRGDLDITNLCIAEFDGDSPKK